MSNIILPPCPHETDGSIESHLESTCTDPWSPTNHRKDT